MTYQPLPKVLAGLDLFASVPAAAISDLVASGTTHSVPPGGTLATQGSSEAGLQVVLEGSAHVEVSGERRPDIGVGDYFGEISLIDGHGRSATVTAGPDGVTTFAISQLNFSPLIDRYPEVARSLLLVLCARIRRLEAAQ